MFDKFEVLMSWKLSWGLSIVLFGVSNGHIFFGFQIIAPYFRRSLHHFPFTLRLLADHPRVNGGRQQHQQYIIYRVHPLKIPSPSAPTIIKTKWPKTTTIKTTITTTITTTTITAAATNLSNFLNSFSPKVKSGAIDLMHTGLSNFKCLFFGVNNKDSCYGAIDTSILKGYDSAYCGINGELSESVPSRPAWQIC